MKYKLAIIGSGSLGRIIGEVVTQDLQDYYEISGILSRKTAHAKKLADDINCKAYISLKELIDDQPDYVVEAASPDVFKDMGVEILAKGIHFIPLSVGALADKSFYNQVKETALQNNSRVYIPSGAVGGLDVLHGSVLMEDANVQITTEKSPESLDGAPFLKGRTLSEDKPEEIFSGLAREAIAHFPENVNVAVTTALATTGVNNTAVSIRSIPGFKSNKHTITLEGDTIKVQVTVETEPSEDNPKSSTLAAYSVIRLLKNLVTPIVFQGSLYSLF